jgi:tripartite-type tricarboxylate transporter receptor subunit TctC
MSPAEAQSWPTQPVRLVVPFAAGGSADLSARIVADELGRHLGQPVIVENRSGAGSSVGTGFVAASPPDGHTILYATSSFSYMKWLVPSLRFSPEADLTPVAVIGKNSYVLVTNNAFPARTFSEVVSTLRGNPGRYFYASAGIGSGMHFMFEYFLATAGGLRVTHVPYRGGGAAMTDLIAGQVQLMADPASSTIPHIAAGSVRPIAVTSLERLAVLPDVPTIAESGLPEFRSFEASGWLMALVPARTPSAVVAKINEAINKAITSEQGTRRLAEINIQVPRDNSPEAAARFLDREFRTWAEVARKSGIKPE